MDPDMIETLYCSIDRLNETITLLISALEEYQR